MDTQKLFTILEKMERNMEKNQKDNVVKMQEMKTQNEENLDKLDKMVENNRKIE